MKVIVSFIMVVIVAVIACADEPQEHPDGGKSSWSLKKDWSIGDIVEVVDGHPDVLSKKLSSIQFIDEKSMEIVTESDNKSGGDILKFRLTGLIWNLVEVIPYDV